MRLERYNRYQGLMAILLGFSGSLAGWTGEAALSRDLNVNVMVSAIGYLPKAPKYCVRHGDQEGRFDVIHITGNETAFTGEFRRQGADFGTFEVGDLTALQKPGTYFIRTETGRSKPFRIGADVHQEPARKILSYFALQRCGPSETGYLAPCHLDDGVRKDNGKHQDVTGGWHDASDLRKWVGATIYGMHGLGRLAETLPAGPQRNRVLAELRWGNRYFLKMQEPKGYVMAHIGGAIRDHGDNNRWTNNRMDPVETEDELRTIAPPAGQSSDPMTIWGASDDRVIATEPLDTTGQYHFIVAQALMAHLTHKEDADYSNRCLQAARRGWQWATATRPPNNAQTLGAAIIAGVELHRSSGDDQYQEQTIAWAERLRSLQATEPPDETTPVSGFFWATAEKNRPHRDVWHGRLPYQAFCRLLEAYPEHSDAEQWKAVIARYSRNYLAPVAKANAFGLVPLGLYLGEDPGGNRQIGPFYYRYTMRPVEGWWVGINAHVAGAGIGLSKAARILGDAELAGLAQRQLDWIIGVNPLEASTVVGIGSNQPEPFVNTIEFRPPTPRLTGAVMNGLGGTEEDQPARYDGQYNTAEYWTPMVALTLWLLAELETDGD